MKELLVVLPTYNEIENIERLTREIMTTNPKPDVLIIDDSSPDGTGDAADRLKTEFPENVFVVHRPRKSGRGSATTLGCKYAEENGYEFVMEMDCDYSHDPKDIPRLMIEAKNADLVVGSRHLPGGKIIGWNWVRHLNSGLANTYTKIVLGTPNTDHTNGFRCYRVEMLRKIPVEQFESSGFVRQTLLEYVIYKMGFKIREVPTVFIDRRAGASKMSWGERFGGLWSILKLRLKGVGKVAR